LKREPTSEEILRFSSARTQVLSESVSWGGIGALSEKTLHKILKLYVEPDITKHEVKYLGSVADVKNGEGVIEVQTRNYDKLAPKIKKFLAQAPVRVICPLAEEKWLSWIDEKTGEISDKRKSPKKEGIYDALKLLHGIRSVITDPRLTVTVVYMRVDEYKNLNGWDVTGKRGATRLERIPTALLHTEDITSVEYYKELIPDNLGEEFLAKDFCRAIKRTSRYSYYILKLLVAAGALRESGMRGRAVVYQRIK